VRHLIQFASHARRAELDNTRRAHAQPRQTQSVSHAPHAVQDNTK
jgi:hypothetical protein